MLIIRYIQNFYMKIILLFILLLDPAKRKKGSKKEEILNKSNKKIQPEDVNDGDKDEISMKQARFDVFKFGIRGLGIIYATVA